MVNRLWSIVRHKHYYFKMVTFTMLICLVPIIVMSLFFYHNVQSSMRQEIEKANDRYVNQIVQSLEMVVKQINDGFALFMTNRIFAEFELYSLNNYYNEFDDKYKSDDMPALLNYINSKAALLENLDKLRTSNKYIQSVYYVNYDKGLVFTSGYRQYPLAGFYDKGWDKGLEENTLSYPMIEEVRESVQPDGSTLRVVPVIFRPFSKSYCVIINLNTEAIYRNIVGRLGESNLSIAAFSQNGSPLLYDAQAAEAIDNVSHAITEQAVTSDPATESRTLHKLDQEERLITWKSSEGLGWNIAGITDLNEMYQSSVRVQRLFLTVTLLLLLGTAVLTFLGSRSMYKPILRLLQLINTGDSASRSKGEFQLIGQSLADAFEARNKLQLKLKESFPAYQEKFVRSLLRSPGCGIEEAQEKMAFFGLSLEPEGLYLLLVSLDWRELKAAPDIESRELEHLSVMETMAAATGSSRNSLLVELADGGIVVLMNAEESERAVVFAAAERIREGLLAAHGLEGTVGIGGYCESVRDLPRAFREAKEALNYRKFAGGSVVYIGDIRMESATPAPYPKEKEISLILSIKNGDENQATRIFRDFAQEVCADPAHASFTEVQQIFLILLARLMETARELSIEGKELLPDREPVFAVFLKKTEWRSMLEWFEGLIRAMTSRIEDAFEQKNNKHVERAKNILETECGEASLTMVAERLNLNPAYLSRIFKEHSGITFTDYLNKERIRRSQKLLLETDLLVQEISSRLGYSQVNSFIKLFKAMTGFTPSEYRKNRG